MIVFGKQIISILMPLALIGASSTGNLPQNRQFSFGSGNTLLLDLDYNFEITSPHNLNQIVDCSNISTYCFKSSNDANSIFHIVLPRKCNKFRRGKIWSHDGVSTEKIAKRRGAAVTTWYLSSNGRSSVVFSYAEKLGIVGIYYSYLGHNLVQRARRGADLTQYADMGGARNEELPLLPCV